MRQLGTEEKAALLLTSADDDEDRPSNSHDNVGIVPKPKRRRTSHRQPASSSQSIVVFILILSAFILGCVSGVAIILYRMSQDAEHSSSFATSAHLTRVDPTIKTKLLQSITKNNFLNLTRDIDSETDAANRLEQSWQATSSKVFTRVNKLSYDLTLSTYAPSTQWSGIQVLDGKTDGEIKRYNLSPTNEYLTFSSLIKSGRVEAKYIYYANYGRLEDFAYLIKKNQLQLENNDQTVVFIRRKATVISQTEQIRQASRYGFAGVVLFDDREAQPQMNTTSDRQSFADEWQRRSSGRERQQFLDGTLSQDDRQIVVLVLSQADVQSIFSSESSTDWFPCPSEWRDASVPLKIGGLLPKTKLRLTTFMQEVPVHLPVVFGYLRGTIDADRFVLVGYQLGRKQQEKVLNEIIRAYEQQIKGGWQPRRSIVFCAWSGLSYDHHTIRQWISDNYRLLDRNLIAYIDLGNGLVGNSTLNLHGSPLLQQVAQRAADSVVSPLVHDHACHHRQPQMPMSHEHIHRRRRHGGDHDSAMPMNHAEQGTECEPHKLFDEWLRASKNRIDANRTSNIVQMIDADSSAAFFQLKYGIPSLLIEMTEEQALTKDTFYARKSPAVFNNEIQPEVVAAYAQFVSEVLRQLVDEPLVPFNVTDYAALIEKQTADYPARYQKEYRSVAAQLDDSNAVKKLMDDLTKAIRALQSRIDQASKNNYMDMQILNDKLVEFERLFIFDDQSRRMTTDDDAYRHMFTGPAFGLSNTVVPFPALSNVLYGIGDDPQSELRDASQSSWLKVKQQVQLMTRTLTGFDGLLSHP